MQRRPANTSRRLVGNGGFPLFGAFPSKTRSSPLLSLTLVLLGVFLILGFLYRGSGRTNVVSRIEGDFSSTLELQRAIPILKKTYGEAMSKVLHIGPDTCSVVPKLLKEEGIEAWGVEPYDLEDADANCKSLARKGIVRVADIKFPLPYRSKSFSLVIVSDALDYLSPKYLNKTLPELTRVSANGIVIFTGYPGHQKAKVTELSKFGRLKNGTLLDHYFGRQKCAVSRGGYASSFKLGWMKMNLLPRSLNKPRPKTRTSLAAKYFTSTHFVDAIVRCFHHYSGVSLMKLEKLQNMLQIEDSCKITVESVLLYRSMITQISPFPFF